VNTLELSAVFSCCYAVLFPSYLAFYSTELLRNYLAFSSTELLRNYLAFSSTELCSFPLYRTSTELSSFLLYLQSGKKVQRLLKERVRYAWRCSGSTRWGRDGSTRGVVYLAYSQHLCKGLYN